MTHDPLRRRFGHGAARLPIGTSTRGPSLSHLAQGKVAHERLFAALPAALCLSLGALFFVSMHVDLIEPTLAVPRDAAPQFADQAEKLPPLEIEFWSDPSVQPAAQELAANPEPLVLAEAEKPAPASEPRATEPPNETPRPSQPNPPPTFDPKRLALRAPAVTPATSPMLRTPAPAGPRGPRSPRPGTNASRSLRPKIDLPTRGQAAPTPVLMARNDAGLPPNKGARPGPRRATGPSDSVAPTWSANSEQRAYLAASSENADGSGDSRTTVPNRLSPVAAAAENRAHANVIRDELRAGGWQQVPLDTLPDCSPAGRQDQLKRQILRAAPYATDRACSDQHGSFKFVETSNLGAFLMWSRTHPEAFTRAARDRDACVVLERALRCLSKTSLSISQQFSN